MTNASQIIVTGVSFLDLPAEVRNTIYNLVVVQQEPIKVHCAARTPLDHQLTPGLLRVNHQVHGEATPVFYGTNLFTRNGSYVSFDERSLCAWLTRIGSARRHLRKVEITHVRNLIRFKGTLRLLKDAENMETLLLGWYVPEKFSTIKSDEPCRDDDEKLDALKSFLPWLRCLRKARKARGDDSPVLDVLQHEDRTVKDFIRDRVKPRALVNLIKHPLADLHQRQKTRLDELFANMKEELMKLEESLAS